MYFVWMLLFGAQPWLVLLAVFGLLGKDAEKAAEDFSIGALIVLVIVVAIVLVVYGLQAVGIIT
jgi:hypothetical protein